MTIKQSSLFPGTPTKAFWAPNQISHSSIYSTPLRSKPCPLFFTPMGCVSSRDASVVRLSKPPSNGRSISKPVVHGSRRIGDSFRVASLISSTLGFHKQNPNQEPSDEETMKLNNQKTPETIINGSETIEARKRLMEEITHHRHQTYLDRSFSLFQLDPIVISNFCKAMTELLSLQHPTLLHRSPVKCRPVEMPRFPGIVKAIIAAFEEKIDAQRGNFKPVASYLGKSPPGGKGKVVIYTTSIRGVRKTFENCCNTRLILRIYGVRVDERDVLMHGGYRDELNEILGYGYGGTVLPRVFVNGRYLGGAEEVARLHEAVELGEVLKDCEIAAEAVNGGGGVVACEGCGDYRFVPCVICWGSCKVFVDEEGDEIGGFRRCINCNENGLVRCHLCY